MEKNRWGARVTGNRCKNGRSLLLKYAIISDKFYICSFSHINHKENEEIVTTVHEGSEEITQEQQYSQRYVNRHFLSQFLSDFLVFYTAILQYSQRYVYRHFLLSQFLSDLLVFTLLFCNHKRSSVVKMSVRDRQADRCIFLFGFRAFVYFCQAWPRVFVLLWNTFWG